MTAWDARPPKRRGPCHNQAGLENPGNAGNMFPATFEFWQPHLAKPNKNGCAAGPATHFSKEACCAAEFNLKVS